MILYTFSIEDTKDYPFIEIWTNAITLADRESDCQPDYWPAYKIRLIDFKESREIHSGIKAEYFFEAYTV